MDKTSISVSPAPHLRACDGTNEFQLDLLIALVPPVLMAMLCYGQRAMLILIIGAASAWSYNAILGFITHTNRIYDLSAPITGFLFAMLLPSSAPLWVCFAGSFIAIVIVRELTGGASKAIFNPAIAAAVFMVLVFPDIMNDIPAPKSSLDWFENTPYFRDEHTSGLWAMFIGKYPGYIGTFSPVSILTGGIYLTFRRDSFRFVTPAFVVFAAVGAVLYFGGDNTAYAALAQLFSGTLLFTAVYLAHESFSSPVTVTGKIIFGAGCGFLTMLIRNLGYYSDGTGFAVLLMNALVWFIDLTLAPYVVGLYDPVKSLVKRVNRGKERGAE